VLASATAPAISGALLELGPNVDGASLAGFKEVSYYHRVDALRA